MISSLINRLLPPKSSPPASARTSNKYDDDKDDGVSTSSYFQKTVCLYNWWLVRADKDYQGKRLAVAGFTSRELQAMRVFTSAPIVKIYDPFSLETSDGIYIIIKGFINKSRTTENGFSSEIFSHFNLGFHRDWEAYADKCFVKDFKAAADPESDTGIANSNSNAIPVDHKNVKGKSKCNAGDVNKSSENIFEDAPANAPKSSDSPGHATNLNGIGNKKNHASKKLPPLRNCDITNVCSLEENLVVPAEPSSSHMSGSSERMANLKSRRKCNIGTATKSKPRERTSLEVITIWNAASRESPVPKGSDVDTGNTSNLDSAASVGDSYVALRTSSSELKTLERQKENDKSNEGLNYEDKNSKLIESLKGNKERSSIVCGLRPEGSDIGSVSLLSDETRNIEENDYLCGELQEPIHSTPVRDNLKSQGCKTISQAGTPKQKKNKLAKSPRGPGDMNHVRNLKTAFDERERNFSSRKKAKRKLSLDAHASPHTQERKGDSSIVSPESLSLKRSRSGRLLLPSLDFWRNQIAVYDAGRKITGIQEGFGVLKSPKGMKSEPLKKKKPKN